MATKYEQLMESLKKGYKTKKNLDHYSRIAKLYWNPRNFDRGDGIRMELGIDTLFDEVIKKHTGRNRFLLRFHDEIEDMTNRNELLMAIEGCPNFEDYAKLWRKYAPKRIRSRAMLLYALIDMTAKGGETEKRKIEKLRKQGNDVRLSSSVEDFAGIDIYVNGRGKQIKSEGTLRAAKRAGYKNNWI